MKAVILAGGHGRSLHPLTRITNKHLLPIYDRPMVSYAIEAVARAGMTEIMLVIGGVNAGDFFRLLGNGNELGAQRLLYAYQECAGGIAEALGLARRFAGEDRVLVLLADNLFEHSLSPSAAAFGRQGHGARVVLARVGAIEHLRHVGVAELEGSRIRRIVEKPEDPPSPFAVAGAYFYDETVWDMLAGLERSNRGELEITDVNNRYISQGRMEHDTLQGFWGDAGESIDSYHVVNDFVRFHGVNKDEESR